MWVFNDNRMINLAYARCIEPEGTLGIDVIFIDDTSNLLSYETEKERDDAFIKMVECLGYWADGSNLRLGFIKKWNENASTKPYRSRY